MSAPKRSLEATSPPRAPLRESPVLEREDVTALFYPPAELLKQAAASDDEDEDETRLQRHPVFAADDEMTVVAPVSASFPDTKPSTDDDGAISSRRPASSRAPLSGMHPLQAPAVRPLPASPLANDIGQTELDAILGPRRAARWLTALLALALLAGLAAVCYFAP